MASIGTTLQEQLEHLQHKYPNVNDGNGALELAIEAAELHLKHLRLAESPNEKALLKQKTVSLFDEAEKLKKSKNSSLSDNLKKLIFGDHPVGKAQSHLIGHDVASASARAIRKESLEAESARSLSSVPSTPVVRNLAAPRSTQPLSSKEVRILLEGSRFNGALFPAWNDEDNLETFTAHPEEALFNDGYMYRMSREQLEMLDDWKRPPQALPPPQWPSSSKTQSYNFPDDFMKAKHGIDLVQDAATDCSVVASLTAAHARKERGFEKILSGAIHPYDHVEARPRYSSSGKYNIRLNFNGCFRKVTIDDRLPVSNTSRILHVVDRNNPALLWPALLEKAYLKVCGGYDFPGSNSGTDLWVMTGWIPEQVLLQHDETDPGRLWQRIHKAFGFGDVVITLGTGKLSRTVERELGLVGEHDYAVLAMKDEADRQRFLIKNPWLGGVERQAEEPLKPGTFWLDLHNVMQNFDNMYLNWNPGLFRHRQDTHFSWDLSPEGRETRSPTGSYVNNPQYTFSCTTSSPAWILLSKHIPYRLSPTHATTKPSYLSLHLFKSNGKRVNTSKGALSQRPYVDSPYVLLKIDAEASVQYTVVVSEQDLPAHKHNFTLSVFSASLASLSPSKARFPNTVAMEGAWTRDTAGGHTDLPSYHLNPQYSFTLPRASHVSVLLQTAVPNLRIHAILLHSPPHIQNQPQRIYAFIPPSIVTHTGPYRPSFAIAETPALVPLPAGNYTIIPSTYLAGELGAFKLQVDSDVPASLRLIPREGGGRLRRKLHDASFSVGVCTIAAPLQVRRLNRVSFAASYSGPGFEPGNSPLRVSVELGRGPDKRVLASSDRGRGGGGGSARTNEIDLGPEMAMRCPMWLVLERHDGYESLGRSAANVGIDMWTDVAGGVEVGQWQER